MSEAPLVIPKSLPTPTRPASPGLWQQFMRFARQNTIGMIGLVVILSVILVAIFAPLIAPYPPTDQTFRRLLEPSAQNWLGTDELGRDVFSRIVYGARISLYVGI